MQKATTLVDFTVQQKLGEGSFGQVFKVKRNSDGQEYAMKKVRMGCLKMKERENALNEIRILASIKDANIIGYKEAFMDDQSNSLCVIMEYASNGDIQKQIQQCIRRQQTIDESEIWRALVQMTHGVRVLHRAGILHRDLKCANVFKSADGTFKIGDMNVSKVSHGQLAKTQTGTPYYASPEVWKDQPYSSPSDIWSLGCVIYEMATLKPPFRGQDLKSLFRKVQSGIYEKLPKQYSKELQSMVAALLKVPPQLRLTCDQILNDPATKMHASEFIPREPSNKAELLQTILLPKNLKQIKLPKPMYDNQNNDPNMPAQKPKSQRSLSVNEPKSCRGVSQTPQYEKKKVDQVPKPNLPIPKKQNSVLQRPPMQQIQLQQRPSSGMRAQSPTPSRKSVDKARASPQLQRKQSAQLLGK